MTTLSDAFFVGDADTACEDSITLTRRSAGAPAIAATTADKRIVKCGDAPYMLRGRSRAGCFGSLRTCRAITSARRACQCDLRACTACQRKAVRPQKGWKH